jgi:DNA-binding transcriptional LysR family regulator
MDAERLLSNVWNWLPAFRGVAEAQHLPTASRRLHVSVSALSRTIRLLEEQIGRELFNRRGRHLVLNTAGEQLLAQVQQAMRSAGRGLQHLTGQPLAGPLRVSSLGVLTNSYVVPALLALKRSHPDLVPSLDNHRASEANRLLVEGQLDVAFYYDALSHEALSIERLGESTNSVYCGRGHPLFDARRLTERRILEHEFSVPAVGDKGGPMDNWPVEVPRRIGMRIVLLWTNLEVCLSGRLLTVLPDVVAYPFLRTRRLRRLPLNLIPPTDLYAARRGNEPRTGAAEQVISAVRQQVAEVDERLGSRRNRSQA